MQTFKYLRTLSAVSFLALVMVWSGTATAQGLINLLRAGGDLTGFYPNPTIRTGAVTGAKIAPGAVTSDKLSQTGVQAGVYTNPTITVGADGRLTNAQSGEQSFETLTVTGEATIGEDLTVGEDIDVTGSATIGENLDVGGSTAVGVTVINTGSQDVEPVAIDATSGYVLIDCDASQSCPITSLADGRPGQTLIIECVAVSGLNPNCSLSMNLLPNLAIQGTAFFMNSPDVSAGQGGSGDNITLIWAPRTNFQGAGFKWVEIARTDH